MIGKLRQELVFFASELRKEGSFARNFSYAFSGKVAIVIFTVLTTPLLTRLYSPEAYGYFAFMNSVASNVSIVATLGFPAALLMTTRESEFYNLFFFILIIILAFIFIFGAFFFVFLDTILPFELDGGKWWYAGITVFASLVFSLMQIFPRWNTWRSQFKLGAKINVLVNGSSRVTSLLIGYFVVPNQFGIMVGDITGKLFGLVSNIVLNVRREWKTIITEVDPARIRAVVVKYRRYPYYILTAGYLSTLSAHLPLLVFPYVFSASSLGNYSLATGLIAIPVSLLASPLSSVFLKRVVTLEAEDPERIPGFIKRVTYALYLAGVIPFALVVSFGPGIFSIVFGEQWAFAGTLAAILAMQSFMDMIQQPLQSVLQVFRLEHMIFRYNLIQLLLVLMLMLPGLYFRDAVVMVWGLTVARIFFAFVIIRKVFKLCELNPYLLFFRMIAVFLCVLAILQIVKNGWAWAW